MSPTTKDPTSLVGTTVIVHPLVLLSATDHYNRVAKGTKKRVIGCLLGQNNGSVVNVANSFAVPFEESDEKDFNVFFIDRDYIEEMFAMFRKVNAREKIIGWYHSGPKLRASDLEINELFRRYHPNPVLVIIDVNPKDIGLPIDAYFSIEEIKDDGTATQKTFMHVASEVEAEEAEEIGVEHLLRDVKDVSVGTLSTRVSDQLNSLIGLYTRLQEISSYLAKVKNGSLPVNHQIIYNLQDIFNLIPNLDNPEFIKAFTVKTNDQLLVVYLSSLIRSIIALHNLINNKIENMKGELGINEDEERGKNEKDRGKDGKSVIGDNNKQAKEGDEDVDMKEAKADDKSKEPTQEN